MACAARTRPSRRQPGAYAYPPLSHEPRIQQLFDGLKREGHHPFHLPVAILLDEHDGKALPHSPCIRCDAFDGYPCLTNGKADAQIICVDPALRRHANLTLLTNSYVDRLTTELGGRRVSGVEVVARIGNGRPIPATSSSLPAVRCHRRC